MFWLTACAKAPSSDIKSDSLFLSAEVSVRGNMVDCKASLTVGGENGTQVDLSDEDVFSCEGQRMQSAKNGLGQITYVASVPLKTNGTNLTYRVQLNRPSEVLFADVALSSVIEGVQVMNDSSLNMRTQVVVTWQPSRNPSEVLYATLESWVPADTSLQSFTRSNSGAPETGSLSFYIEPVSRWNSSTGQYEVVPAPYDSKLVLSRSVRGKLDGVWKGGINSVARKVISLKIAP
jgi:hypothetical protein